jgi:serine acetyltransferase/quercetin dioxygenase-like cupin family protein
MSRKNLSLNAKKYLNAAKHIANNLTEWSERDWRSIGRVSSLGCKDHSVLLLPKFYPHTHCRQIDDIHEVISREFSSRGKNSKEPATTAGVPASDSLATVEKTILLRTTASYDGVEYTYPLGQVEFTVVKFMITPNAVLPIHSHPVPCVGYVMSGSITIVNGDESRTYCSGEVIPEVVNTSHFGETESEPCVLIVFYAGAVGIPLTVNKGDKIAKAQYTHGISENAIAQILDLRDIDAIVENFKERFTALGGTKEEIEREFASVKKLVQSDLSARLLKDPAVKNDTAFVLECAAFRALLLYRVTHALWAPLYIKYAEDEIRNARRVALEIHNFARCRYLIEIHPGASIGKNLYLDHGLGVKIQNGVLIGEDCGILDGVILIGEQTSIGNDCTIEGGVLCGAYLKRNPSVVEMEKKRGRRHPVIGNNCFLCRGVKVLGPVIVADNTFLPIGTVVTSDYPKPQ